MRIVALLIVIATSSCGVARTGDDSVDAALSLLRERYVGAFNAGDTAGVLTLYAEDATLVSDGGTFKGHSEIARWLDAGVSQGSRLEPVLVEASSRSGTLAYVTGSTRRHVGTELHRGQYLIVMERLGTEWRIVRHFSITSR
jgi:ketosteroid isomerase-like protein